MNDSKSQLCSSSSGWYVDLTEQVGKDAQQVPLKKYHRNKYRVQEA